LEAEKQPASALMATDGVQFTSMKKTLLFAFLLFGLSAQSQDLWGGIKVDVRGPSNDSLGTTNLNQIASFVRQQTVGRATGQTAANSSVATLTVGGTDASYKVSGNILVTTSSAEAFSMSVDWTDEGNTARTTVMPLLRIATGSFTPNTAAAFGAVPYPSIDIHIRCKSGTAVTIKTSGTFTGCTYNVEGHIQKI